MTKMTAEQAGCDHDNFQAMVGVGRLTSEEGGPVTSYTAEIRIQCGMCKLPFRFLGVPQGSSFYQPMASADDTELRAPIAPGPGFPSQKQTFEIPPKDETKDKE